MANHLLLFLILIPFIIACNSTNSGVQGPEIPGKLVFGAKGANDEFQIFKMNADGSKLRQLTSGSETSYQPSWSPDGKQIIFSTSRQSSSNGFSLFVMDANGNNMRPMNNRKDSPIPTPGSFPRWHPNGQTIAFFNCINCQIATNTDILVYDIASDSVSRLTEQPGEDNFPAWSPDGTRIVFSSGRDYLFADTMRFRRDLYMMNADGSGLERLTENGFVNQPIWGPDNNSVTYRSINRVEEGLSLFKVDLLTKERLKIEINLNDNRIQQLVPFAWTTNGRYLFVSSRFLSSSPSNPFSETTLLIIDRETKEARKLPFSSSAAIAGGDWFIPQK